MKLKDLFEEQRIIKGNVALPHNVKTLIGYKLKGILITGAKINGDFDCSQTGINSLKGGPNEITGNFDCSYTNIASLEGAPKEVGGGFFCSNTRIESLHDIHKQINYIGGLLSLSSTVKSHILGVMFIKGLKGIINFKTIPQNIKQNQVIEIINKHLKGERNPHEAQEELIDAGLSEYAKI